MIKWLRCDKDKGMDTCYIAAYNNNIVITNTVI